MRRSVFAICLVASSICAHSQTSTIETRDAKLISHVKQMPVSQLDPALPQLSFEKWLKVEAGPEAEFYWEVAACAEQGAVPEGKRDLPLCVEANAHMKDGRTIVILIAAGTAQKPSAANARFLPSQLITVGETIPIHQLSDLPPALVRTHRLVSYPEVAQ
jgi:hypothetical protein